MSLKGFHIVFVLATIALTLYFGYWAFEQYKASNTTSYLVTAICSFIISISAAIYGVLFYKKVKI